MRYFTIFSLVLVAFFSVGCQKDEVIEYGPRGYDGRVYFGVDYDYGMLYSYADNNPSIPFNPALGHHYPSEPGLFQFEYFINPYEYWYGTYELWFNPGQPGGPYGEPGLNGADTYLLLICNPDGFYEDRFIGKSMEVATKGDTKTITTDQFKITMKKVSVKDRAPQLEVKLSK